MRRLSRQLFSGCSLSYYIFHIFFLSAIFSRCSGHPEIALYFSRDTLLVNKSDKDLLGKNIYFYRQTKISDKQWMLS